MNQSGLTFEHPWFLIGLLLIGAGFWWQVRRWPAALRVGSVQPFVRVPQSLRARLRVLPDVLRALGLVVLVIAMARPQQVDTEVLSGEGLDIMIALDMSGSMNVVDMADDAIAEIQAQGREPDNRFEAARRLLKDFIRKRKSDRVGLVIFGSEAYLRFPPTLDYVRLLNALDDLVLDNGRRSQQSDERCTNGCTINGGGTAIGDALNRAYLRLEKAKSRSKMLILITDGKQEGGKLDALTIPKYIAAQPEKERVRVFTFQVGSGTESKLPAFDPLRNRPLVDRLGRMKYARPERPFPTDPELLKQIAQLSGGKFYDSYDSEKFAKDFADLERSTFKVKVQTSRKELFFPWLLVGLVLLLTEQLLRRTWLRTVPD